jgi:hypothetical protein
MNEGKTGYKVVKHAAAPKQPKVKKRNPVAKNAAAAIGGGAAGAHKDKKKAEKQGDTKHKKRVPADMMEGAAYDKRLELLLKIAQVKETLEEAKKGLYYYVNKRKKAGTSRSQGHPDAPSAQDWKDAAKTAKKESVEDRTSYQVAKVLADKGITYDPARESELIKAIGIILVKELNMSPRQARSVMNDEDFLGDTFGELRHMGQGMAEAFGPLPRDNQQIRLGRHTVNIERVGEDKDFIGFAWHDSKGQDHYEEVSVGDLGSYDDLIDRIKQEISYQERQYTDQGVAEGYPKHQDLSGISTEKLKAYLAKQSQQQVSGEGNQVKRVRAELQSREQGVAEGKEDKIAQLKKDYDTAVHWSKNETSPQKREAARQKAEKIKAHLEKQYKQGVAEGDNPEYDDEAGMADNNLETLKRAVQGLDNLIGEGDNLPEWCQEKIAVAKSMLVTVWDYMESEEQHGKA